MSDLLRRLGLHARLFVLAFLTVLALGGCPKLPEPDGCTPAAQRCHGDRPEVCSAGQRWTHLETPTCAAAGGVCCRAMSPFGRAVHACTSPDRCLPEAPAAPVDAAPMSDASDQ